jgi:hypothetical protein
MSVAGFQAPDSYFQIAGPERPYNQNIALMASLFQVLPGSEGKVELSATKWDWLDDIGRLFKFPREAQSFNTREGIFVRVVCEQFQFLNLTQVHHARLGDYEDAV